ncbi:MAG TPA: ATP-dependent DNA helicase, partial [Polyangia bacterium]|nr:ATP-dependent DNA helicase [Polyangia bacterium]
VGSVDLVCQIGSPRAVTTFLQRIGRSGHALGRTSKGRLFATSRDELVECAALLDSVRRGELDTLCIPENLLDVLAQQIVAETAAREWSEDGLYELIRGAWPYRDLPRADFDAAVGMLAEGFSTRRGRRGALIHHDAVNHMLRGRRGARITALTSGGTIPDTADYQVLLEPENQIIGTVNEDWAVESMAGDVFQLGNASYRIQRVERGVVRVEDAEGQPPTIPFWLGEAPGRSDELSAAVSRLREEIEQRLSESPSPALRERVAGVERRSGEGLFDDPDARPLTPTLSPDGGEGAIKWLSEEVGIGEAAARQLVDYLAAAHAALGVLPTLDTLVFERFFDAVGGMQLVIHSPYGSRLNRAWGLALRKRFCARFNFELQAAATEDNISLSLTTVHSFALDEVPRYLHSASVRQGLTQALLDAPMFMTRWRWVSGVALALPRFRGGKKVPPQLMRMEAEDLVAAIFPDQLACAENIAGGEREIPDHPLVTQTIHDCLSEAMDIEGLERLLSRIESGEVRVVARDVTEPSPLALEVLAARPYAYLDGAPLEERRTQAVMGRRWLTPEDAADLGRLDPEAIARVREEAWPAPVNADEMHDALVWLGFLDEREVGNTPGWAGWLGELAASRRAARLRRPGMTVWIAAERLPQFESLWPEATLEPLIAAPASYAERVWSADLALVEILRGRLEGLGPVTAEALAAPLGMSAADIAFALAALESEGFAMRGCFTDGAAQGPWGEEWCERRLLARIHRYTVNRLRAEIEPVAAKDFLRFLFEWQRVAPGARMEGPDALAAITGQLEGFEAAAGAWESEILPARLAGYDPAWLDDLCLSGRVAWARLRPRGGRAEDGGRSVTPVRSTPIALLARRHTALWSLLSPTEEARAPGSQARRVADVIRQEGALFF